MSRSLKMISLLFHRLCARIDEIRQRLHKFRQNGLGKTNRYAFPYEFEVDVTLPKSLKER